MIIIINIQEIKQRVHFFCKRLFDLTALKLSQFRFHRWMNPTLDDDFLCDGQMLFEKATIPWTTHEEREFHRWLQRA